MRFCTRNMFYKYISIPKKKNIFSFLFENIIFLIIQVILLYEFIQKFGYFYRCLHQTSFAAVDLQVS